LSLTINKFKDVPETALVDMEESDELFSELLESINECIEDDYLYLEYLTEDDLEDICKRIWSIYRPRKQLSMENNNINHDVERCHACRDGMCSYV
jgi:hypothetical protein